MIEGVEGMSFINFGKNVKFRVGLIGRNGQPQRIFWQYVGWRPAKAESSAAERDL